MTKADLAIDNLDVFFGKTSEIEAHVYARLSDARLQNFRISGTVQGPYCEYSRTLPACMRLVDSCEGPSVLAHAVIPDPCFWSHNLPMTYTVELQLLCGDDIVAEVSRMMAIRPFGAAGRFLRLCGRRIVLQGVEGGDPVLHEADIERIDFAVVEPDQCRRADALGV